MGLFSTEDHTGYCQDTVGQGYHLSFEFYFLDLFLFGLLLCQQEKMPQETG